MKKSYFARIIALIASFCEQKFTLSLLADAPNNFSGATSGGANGQVINVNVRNTDGSIIDRSGEPVSDPISSPSATPRTLQQKIVNGSATGATTVTAYFMNEDVFNATATNNGSGASTVTNTYADGWSGNGYNNLAKSVNQGRGIRCYGLTMQFIVTSGSAQDGTGLAAANPQMLSYTNVGTSSRPDPSPLNEGLRNTQYLSGIMTVYANFFLSSISQFTYLVPVGDTSTLIINCTPQGR